MPDIAMTNRIMQIHLSSWRYFAVLTLPPLVLLFNLLYSAGYAVLIFLFFITHYYCWRLWLDEQLFLLLNNENDLAKFDEGMAYLWEKKADTPRPLAERWNGTRGLFYRAMISLLTLWLVTLYLVLYQTLILLD